MLEKQRVASGGCGRRCLGEGWASFGRKLGTQAIKGCPCCLSMGGGVIWEGNMVSGRGFCCISQLFAFRQDMVSIIQLLAGYLPGGEYQPCLIK